MITHLLLFNHKEIDAVFFDFDGVLVDSVPIKTEAFKAIFHKYGSAAVDEITRFHLDNGGIDRFIKIRHTLKSCNIPHDENLINALAQEFSIKVKQAVCDQPLIPDINTLIQTLRLQGVKLFIVSGTPEAELQDIVTTKQINNWFIETRGSPKSKEAIVLELIKTHKLRNSHCLFIGDAKTDFDAAKKCSVLFLGV